MSERCFWSAQNQPCKMSAEHFTHPLADSALKITVSGQLSLKPLRASDAWFGSCTGTAELFVPLCWLIYDRHRELQCPQPTQFTQFLLLCLYRCNLQMSVLSFSHEAVRSMFHTQMRWVTLESLVLPLAMYPSCPVNDTAANSTEGFQKPSVCRKLHFLFSELLLLPV